MQRLGAFRRNTTAVRGIVSGAVAITLLLGLLLGGTNAARAGEGGTPGGSPEAPAGRPEPALAAPAHRAADSELARELVRMVATTYPATQPGAAVLVSRDGETLVRGGFGMANLELGVPIHPDSVFEIGSLTKQFTAAAILLLAERGKLRLDDEITRFLPDFPTHDQRITLDQLLGHTSGVADYTHLAEWAPHMREDVTPAQLVAFFKDHPLDFKPGEKWAYDNSGYVLLGMVVEKAAGQSYGTFLRDAIFQPLGMTSTRYGSAADLIPHRATGYERHGDAFTNASFISMTQPFAAGALVSTIDDLALWDRALYGTTLLTQASLDRMFAAGRLANGTSTRYGYGWEIGRVGSHPLIWHNGEINGFASALLRVPDQHLLAVVLSNAPQHDPRPETVALQLVRRVLGVPEHPPTIAVDAATLDGYAGVYVDDDGVRRTITSAGGHLFAQRAGGPKYELLPIAPDLFAYSTGSSTLRFLRTAPAAPATPAGTAGTPGTPGTGSTISTAGTAGAVGAVGAVGAAGAVTGASLDAEVGPEIALRRTNEAPPAERREVAVPPALLDSYTGAYALAPTFVITISREGDHLFAQATGQQRFEIFAESPTRFFFKVVDAQIDFVTSPGTAGSAPARQIILHQGGRDLPGQRLPP